MPIMQIPVKGKQTIAVNTDDPSEGGDVHAAVYTEALRLGLQAIIGRKMTKITKENYPNEAELKAAAMAVAQANLVDIREGKIKIAGVKSADGKVSGVVMTEARRIARQLVKDEMKRQKIKVSYVEAKEITSAANALIAAKPEIIEEAKASLAKRDAEAAAMAEKMAEIAQAIPISTKKKADAEAKAAEAKKQLSAAKAGKVQPHMIPQRPKAPQLHA